ncbi:ATP-dependent helicase HrpB [Rhodocaloribacter litoris]|uniref:ATP-dependent helicase HrpB n=1 Tax=Rhodocaloribacter litoris TaxID=2558931 RepID=UPI0014230C84|nr:ATP-dependent helicase HrpB [Rhodocaloribacter litoris]QXD17030.1 ATP-dependent helicase HrpB [Rhodocaloribacter litoris]
MRARSSSAVLPVETVLPSLKAVLAEGPCAVLQAPPGAGKTTRVPLALLGEAWLEGQRLLLLEPRRLAARAAAHYMAALLGERVGETVGYRMRMDSRTGPRTRIEVITEGVLTRLLIDDPGLSGVGLIIFDEFHERSLHADVGLALCREVQQVLRPDLRLLAMSATLAARPVADFLGGAPVVESAGRTYPVETHYLVPERVERPLPVRVARAVHHALARHPGDVLVFLPGAAEIRQAAARLEAAVGPAVDVYPLFGNLPYAAQERALAPAPEGRRKVVLATSIAETSLTVEGVRVVVDGGLMRVPRFDPATGMTRLVTVRVTRDAADQRRGRAGRTAPGVCYRLWPRHEPLVPHRTPEILEADLAPLVLDLAAWGVYDPAAIAWLDPPPPPAFEQARDLLRRLGALDASGRLTDEGRRMAALPLHPRLAHMLLQARNLGLHALAADLAALLEEQDVLRGEEGPPPVDLGLRLELLRTLRAERKVRRWWHGHPVETGTLHRVRKVAERWRRNAPPADTALAGRVLALAYPDRLARLDGAPGRFRLADGRRATLSEADPLAHQDYLVAAVVDGPAGRARIHRAAALTREDIEAVLAGRIEETEVVDWDREREAVRARRVRHLGAVVLSEAPLPDPPPEAVARVLLDRIAEIGLHVLPWTREATRLRQRIRFLHYHRPGDWPDVSDEHLLATLPVWLGPYVQGLRRLDDLRRVDLAAVLAGLLDGRQHRALDRLAPDRLEVPSGSRIALDYSDPRQPVLAVRLQEVFGLTETPRIAGGAVPVTLHLLSPAHRPVQVTQDLAGFWRTTYFEVRKDLRGRYPKHHWPEDPTTATPTRHTRPRR